ncbi:MAG: RIP metalloprotease [Pseudomonadota bacterium]|nr:RIP metalloprotease [Pseudomonadota bacterium]
MLDWLLTPLTYLLPFLFVLTVVVTVHELGHFWTARAFGTAIDRFSIGFGRAIVRWTDKSGVEWRIGWLPLGGYVSFAGDETVTSVPDREALETLKQQVRAREGVGAERRYFHFKPVWQRALIVAAGPFANFVLSVGIFAALLGVLGEVVAPPRVAGVEPGSAAERAGFKAGDLIVAAQGRPIDNFLDVREIVAVRAGSPIEFVVERDGERLTLVGTPERRVSRDEMGSREIGVLGLENSPRDHYRRRLGPLEAVPAGVERTWRVLETSLVYIGRIFTGRESGDQLSGPLGIAQASGAIAQAGADAGEGLREKALGALIGMVGLTAILSVGIGFLNLLPVPVLDGGHLAFYAYEAVARRPLGAGVQAASYRVGLALLLGLMLFVTWNDLQRLQVFQFLGRLFS